MTEGKEAKPSKLKVFTRRLGSASFLYGVLLVGLFARNDTLSCAAFGGIITLLGVACLTGIFRHGGEAKSRANQIAGALSLESGQFWLFFGR